MLSDTQIERYSRQIILHEVGGKGQEALLRTRVLVNGTGPLQSATLLYLAAAGVGTVGVIAPGPSALLSALSGDSRDAIVAALTSLNPDCQVIMHAIASEETVQQYDLVLSQPDALHDTCYALRRPFLCAHISSGSAWLFCCTGYEPNQPCLHCLPDHLFTVGKEEDTETAALFWGTLQTTEAIKLILGLNPPSQGKLVQCQFPGLDFSENIVTKNPSCSWCG
jgi:molybdopterin-synthase adenylyltransferase